MPFRKWLFLYNTRIKDDQPGYSGHITRKHHFREGISWHVSVYMIHPRKWSELRSNLISNVLFRPIEMEVEGIVPKKHYVVMFSPHPWIVREAKSVNMIC